MAMLTSPDPTELLLAVVLYCRYVLKLDGGTQ